MSDKAENTARNLVEDDLDTRYDVLGKELHQNVLDERTRAFEAWVDGDVKAFKASLKEKHGTSTKDSIVTALKDAATKDSEVISEIHAEEEALSQWRREMMLQIQVTAVGELPALQTTINGKTNE